MKYFWKKLLICDVLYAVVSRDFSAKTSKTVLWEENVSVMLGGEPVELDDTAERLTKKSKLLAF